MVAHLSSTPVESIEPAESIGSMNSVRVESLPHASLPQVPGEPERAEPAKPLAGRLKIGAAWVVLSRSLGIGVTMLVNIALARWLSPEDFGSFLLLSSLLAVASLVAMIGLNAAIVRFVSESLGKGDLARARQSLRLLIAVSIVSITSVAGLAALGFSYFDVTLFSLPAVEGIVPMAVASLVLLAILQLIAEACRSLHELRLASVFSGGQTGGLLSNIVFLLLIAIGVTLVKPTFFAAVMLNLMAMSICVPIAIFGLRVAMRTRLSGPMPKSSRSALSVGQLLTFSLPMLAIQLLTFTTTQADLWIAGIYWPHDQLALYGAARRLVLLVTLPLQMANLTVIASIAELHAQQRHQDLERILRRASSLAALPSFAAILVLIFFGGPILKLLFGPFFAQAALPLAILGAGNLVLVWAGSCGCTLEMTGHQAGSLLVNLVCAITLGLVGSWAARQFGILGLAISSSTIIALQSISLWLLAKKVVGVWTHPILYPLSEPGSAGQA